jgi:hypothetical protein
MNEQSFYLRVIGPIVGFETCSRWKDVPTGCYRTVISPLSDILRTLTLIGNSSNRK